MAEKGWVGGAIVLTLALGACGGDGDDLVDPRDCSGVVESVEFEFLFGGTPVPRIGDVIRARIEAADECGRSRSVTESTWSSDDPSVVTVGPALARIGNEGEPFVIPDEGVIQAVGFGSTTVRVEVAETVGTLEVDVVRPPTRSEGLEVFGADSVSRRLTDLWVHGRYGYTGTTAAACGGLDEPPCSTGSGSLVVWRLDGGLPTAIDSVTLPGPRSNDVKVSPDGEYLVVSQERNEATNGIVVLDLADPGAPTILTHFTDELEGGVHNVWLENIDGTDWAFVVEDGSGAEERLHVLDLSDPSAPLPVARWVGGTSSVHDVYVRDGLAFVSHWDDGLFILDVGNGMAGGSPANPVEVGSLVMSGGNTHNAWYWPGGELVFVGEERFAIPPDTLDVGQLHVVDVRDPTEPREIATFRIPGETPHNFWLDEENEILYAGWYDRGVRALDVSGTLSGDLAAAGQEIGFLEPSGSRGLARIWAPQLHEGVLYLSDPVHGLWAVTPLR